MIKIPKVSIFRTDNQIDIDFSFSNGKLRSIKDNTIIKIKILQVIFASL